jgi:purine-nucleoside/S-methyl-5'-thioadenosine phosphorylase / adenosine deaminase
VTPLELRFDLPGATALFTTRADANLSSVGGDGRHAAIEARERLRTRIGVAALARGYQVHGTSVQRVAVGDPTPDQPTEYADGQATALRGTAAIVLAADCLPVVIAGGGAVAAVHAGWRGLAAGVLEEGVRAVSELGGAEPARLAAVVGPGAGGCCYVVGPEVHQVLGSAPGATTVDLAAVAMSRLRMAGLEDVRVVEACTICDERFFSHRREGARAGRQGAVVWLS